MVKLKTLKLLICFSVSCFFFSEFARTANFSWTWGNWCSVKCFFVVAKLPGYKSCTIVKTARIPFTWCCICGMSHSNHVMKRAANYKTRWNEVQTAQVFSLGNSAPLCIFFLLTFNMLLWQSSGLKTCTSCLGWLLQSWEGLVFPDCWHPWLFTYK